ncbi:MAG: hypothetical protein ACREVL_01050 [Solimonas sp.]
MHRVLGVFGVFLLFLLASGSVAAAITPDLPAPQEDSAAAARQFIAQARARLENNDWEGAATGLDQAIRAPGFVDLPQREQYAALSTAGSIALRKNDWETAYRLQKRASEYPQSKGGDWHGRLSGAFRANDFADAAHCISVIAARWPQTLDEINSRAIFWIAERLRDDMQAAQVRIDMLSGLFDAAWTDGGSQPSFLWLSLVQDLLSRDDLKKARMVAARLDSARVILQMRVDKRFDRLVQRSSPAFDVDRVARLQIQDAERRVQQQPDLLRPLIDLQYLLLDALQAERVLALGDEVIQRVRDADGAPIYRDFKDEYIWILDNRARALQRLGRWDEAVAQQRKAALRPENGDMNVSQAINLGTLLAMLDRPDDAAAAVADLGGISAYGRMQLEMVKLLVAIESGDEAAATRHLDFIREHRNDAMVMYQNALQITSKLDEAADLLVERLRNESTRAAALAGMQDYAEVPLSPRDLVLARSWKEIIASPKVRAELAKVGRIERVRLAPPIS